MAALKTQPNDLDPNQFLENIEDDQKRMDSYKILELMKKISDKDPVMWGDSIIGFGSYNYIYPTGTKGTWFLTGCSPRKRNMTVYLMPGAESMKDNFEGLGKYKLGKGCLYFNKLADINQGILENLVKKSIGILLERYADYN